MTYVDALQDTMSDYRSAELAIRLAEARRNDVIREAHREGALSTRQIANIVDLPFQRVAEIVAGDPDGRKRPTLHVAMQSVLKDTRGDWMPVHEIARHIYEHELYRRKDRGVIQPGQIRARAAKYPDLFEGSQDGTNRIRLRVSG